MEYYLKIKKSFMLLNFILILTICLSGCAKYALTDKENMPQFEQQKRRVSIGIKDFIDKRPKEEKEGLTERTKKILSFATKDSDFKEKIDKAIIQRIKLKLHQKGFCSDIITAERGEDYILEGEIRHFQAVMRLPNTTFVPYLGTAATVITKDEFNIAVSIKATLKDAKNNKILFSEVFDASDDLNLSTGLLNLARFKRGINYRFKALDEALESILAEIAQKTQISIQNQSSFNF